MLKIFSERSMPQRYRTSFVSLTDTLPCVALTCVTLSYVTSRGIASLQMDLPCVALLRFSGTLFVCVITSPGLLVRHQLIF